MSSLDEKLRGDYLAVQKELAKLEDRQKLLRFQLQYIETLLGDIPADDVESPVPSPFAGMTISDIAVKILAEANVPLSAMDIARRAMEAGWDADNIERARSHFSAVISKDVNSEKPRFWHVERGSIALVEWKGRKFSTSPAKQAMPRLAPSLPAAGRPTNASQTPAKAPPPAATPAFKDTEFKDDDIPF